MAVAGDVSDAVRSGRRVGMKDVAARAGVAVSSVSRVLSGSPDVSPTMRNRVLDAVSALKYEKDLVAQSMRSGTTYSLGFAAIDIANPSVAEMAGGALERLRTRGYSMLITSSQGDVELEGESLKQLKFRRVDGLMVSLADETSDLTRTILASLEVPTVLLDRDNPLGLACSSVVYDHGAGMGQAMEHLLALGHRRVALINGSKNVRPSRERAKAVRRAAATVAEAEVTVRNGAYSFEHGFTGTMKLMRSANPPTAIIAGGNQILQGTLAAIKEAGLRIPDDLSLVALDNAPFTELLEPQLDRVLRDPAEMGRMAADLLVDMLREEPTTQQVVLPTEFRPGKSSAPPR